MHQINTNQKVKGPGNGLFLWLSIHRQNNVTLKGVAKKLRDRLLRGLLLA